MIQVRRLLMSVMLVVLAFLLTTPVIAQDPALIDILEKQHNHSSKYATGYIEPPGWEQEFQRHLKVYNVPRDLPVNFNWMSQQSPVKNQGSCGSCWAFAAVAEIESRVKIGYGLELDLSEQQAVSCNSYGAGCNGGWASAVYNMYQTYGGIMEDSMPYEAADSVPCTQNQYLNFAKISGWNSISNNINQIKTAIYENGPVCSAVVAGDYLEDYDGNCYEVPSSWTDHLVLIVGWDDRACGEQGAWIVKNSWGADFGTAGYFNCRYNSAGMGQGATQIVYNPPTITVDVENFDGPIESGGTVEVNWNTEGGSCSTVDIWWSNSGYNFTERIVENTPNDGSWIWTIPNDGTQDGRICVVANGSTEQGFGFSSQPIYLMGFKTRYVSEYGLNTPPYETPLTAAHSITDAVLACTGLDSVLVVGGDYQESIPVNWTVRLSGGWNYDFTGRDSRNPTRIQGINSAIRFTGGAGEFAGVDGFEFHDSFGVIFDQPQQGRYGGAIYMSDCSAYVTNCTFTDNTGDQMGDYSLGGHIFAMNSSPLIDGNTFTNGSATCGGAIALLDCTDSVINNNVINGSSCYATNFENNGAAIYLTGGSAQMSNNIISDNSNCWQGGAIFMGAATVRGDNLTITNNSSQYAGGGIFAGCGSLELSNCVISSNTTGGGNGGGIGSDCGDVILRNIIVTDNTTTGVGAGVKVTNIDNGIIENCLFNGNNGGDIGAGLFAVGEGSLIVRNNIITNNIGGGIAGTASELLFDYNNVYNNDGPAYEGFVSGSHDLSLDPLLSEEYELLLHSPCVDSGDPELTDPDGSRSNMGAYGGISSMSVAPAAVANASLLDYGNSRLLEWSLNSENDIHSYVIYAGTNPVFIPSSDLVVAVVSNQTTSWIDENPHSGYYYIVALNNDGLVSGYSAQLGDSGTSEVGTAPARLAVTSVAPNPFNPRTVVAFDLPATDFTKLTIYDTRGRAVKTLVSEELEAGSHTVVWNGKDNNNSTVAAGVYLVRLKSGSEHQTVKVVMAK